MCLQIMRKHFGKRAGFGVKRNVAVSGTGLPYSCVCVYVCVCVCTGSCSAAHSKTHTHTHTHTHTPPPPPPQIFSRQHLRHLEFGLHSLCPGIGSDTPGPMWSAFSPLPSSLWTLHPCTSPFSDQHLFFLGPLLTVSPLACPRFFIPPRLCIQAGIL